MCGKCGSLGTLVEAGGLWWNIADDCGRLRTSADKCGSFRLIPSLLLAFPVLFSAVFRVHSGSIFAMVQEVPTAVNILDSAAFVLFRA